VTAAVWLRKSTIANPELIGQLEALKEAIAEAEDIAAEFAAEMYMESKKLCKKLNSFPMNWRRAPAQDDFAGKRLHSGWT
jgi:hypothetical protein